MCNDSDYYGGGCTLTAHAHEPGVPTLTTGFCSAQPGLVLRYAQRTLPGWYPVERRYTIRYINAEDILPAELISQIRNYIEGKAIYIPRADGRAAWGNATGTRAELDSRNRSIRDEFASGVSVTELSEKYCLSTDSIRKILRKS